MNEDNNKRIQNWEGVFMMIVAVLSDLVSIIPIIGNIIALIFGGGTLALWFMIRGVGLVTPKKMATTGISLLIEAIPAISALPAYTVGTLILLAIVRTEDMTGIKLPTPSAKTVGGRSTQAKFSRRMSSSPEHRSEATRRARNIRRIRKEREQTPALRRHTQLQNISPTPQRS